MLRDFDESAAEGAGERNLRFTQTKVANRTMHLSPIAARRREVAKATARAKGKPVTLATHA